MPMHRIALGDDAARVLRVGEVGRAGDPHDLQGTVRGYLSAVLHWLYFTPLRKNAVFWGQFVTWASPHRHR